MVRTRRSLKQRAERSLTRASLPFGMAQFFSSPWWRCPFHRLTSDSEQTGMPASGRPLNILFQLSTGVFTATCGTQLEFSSLPFVGSWEVARTSGRCFFRGVSSPCPRHEAAVLLPAVRDGCAHKCETQLDHGILEFFLRVLVLVSLLRSTGF